MDEDPVLIGDRWTTSFHDSYYELQYERWPVDVHDWAKEQAAISGPRSTDQLREDIESRTPTESDASTILSDSELANDLELARRHGLPIDEHLSALPYLVYQDGFEIEASGEKGRAAEGTARISTLGEGFAGPEHDEPPSPDKLYWNPEEPNGVIDTEAYKKSALNKREEKRRQESSSSAAPRTTQDMGDSTTPLNSEGPQHAPVNLATTPTRNSTPDFEGVSMRAPGRSVLLKDAPPPSCIGPGVPITDEEFLTYFPRTLRFPSAVIFILCSDEKWGSASAIANFIHEARGLPTPNRLRSTISNQMHACLKRVTGNRKESISSWMTNHRSSAVVPSLPWSPLGGNMRLVDIGREIRAWPKGQKAGECTRVIRRAMEIEQTRGSCNWLLSDVKILSQNLP
jgi:hypothetical protein